MQITKPHDNHTQCSPNTSTLNVITLQVRIYVRVCVWVWVCVNLFVVIFNCYFSPLLCLLPPLKHLKGMAIMSSSLKPGITIKWETDIWGYEHCVCSCDCLSSFDSCLWTWSQTLITKSSVCNYAVVFYLPSFLPPSLPPFFPSTFLFSALIHCFISKWSSTTSPAFHLQQIKYL